MKTHRLMEECHRLWIPLTGLAGVTDLAPVIERLQFLLVGAQPVKSIISQCRALAVVSRWRGCLCRCRSLTEAYVCGRSTPTARGR